MKTELISLFTLISLKQLLMLKFWPLYTGAKLNLGDRVLGEVEKNSFIALPSKGGHSRRMSSKLCLNLEGLARSFIFKFQRDPHQFVDLLLIGSWKDKWMSAS